MPQALGKISTVFMFIIYITINSCHRDTKGIQDSDNNTLSLEASIEELNERGKMCMKEKKNKEANRYAQIALIKINKLRKSRQNLYKITPYNIRADYYLDYSYDSSMFYANVALDLAKKHKNKEEEVKALNILGNAHYLSGNYKLALNIWEQCLKIAQEYNMEIEEAKALCNIGVIFKIWGDYTKAIEHYRSALETYEKLNDSILIAKLLNNIGCIYFSYEIDYQKALDYFLRALNIYIQSKDSLTIADISSNIGIVYLEIKQNKKAIEYFTKSINIYKSIGDKSGIANSYTQLGEIQIMLGEFEKALKYFSKAQNIYKVLGEKSNYLYSYAQIAAVYKEMNKLNNALTYNMLYLKHANKQNLKSDILGQYKEISIIYEALGNYKKAIEYYKKYSQFKDSLVNEKNLIQVARLETIYETEKKEKEIIQLEKEKLKHAAEIKRQKLYKLLFITVSSMFFLLTATILISFVQNRKSNKTLASKNYEIEEKNKLLNESIVEKETLLKEVHHRVKNNLQIISSLLNLQSRYINDIRISDEVLEGKNRVKSMALIHETLYSFNNLSSVKFKPYLTKLINYISKTYKINGKKIISDIDVEDISFDIDTAIPLGLIVNELVSNAYKYAFTIYNKGEILVKLSKIDNEKYLIRVSDNGIGLPKDIDLNNIKTLGLQLVKRLIYQLDGELTINTKKGSKFSIVFSKQKNLT